MTQKHKLTAADAARGREASKNAERLDPIERAHRNPQSKTLAIRAFCWDCQGGDANPNPQWLVGNCTTPDCTLYPHRPWQNFKGRPTPTAYQ